METQLLETIVLMLHVAASLCIIGLVLIQHGKGADMGSGLGAGSSSTVFGSGGTGSFLTKATGALAVAFFLTSFGLAFYAKQKSISIRNLGVPEIVEQINVEPELELPTLDSTPTSDTSGGSEIPSIEPETE
ncbi:MAG: preprotein translocase subunit SecG [Pseudomonadales bacterium]|nr:preprotein translocase subunit SecG [Pseudomonadales bacterium]MDG1442353.1 preprotein translocase subunit SecG [Pseudomonadales bacterium]